jgi:transposase
VCARREQLFLLPVSMRDWVDQGHLAWFVIDVVGELETGGLHRRPGGAPGRRPYDPEMMCALVLYAYCTGVRSSRRIEAACRTDAAFRVICGGLVPDHATIARFVVDQERALEGLFVSGLRLCAAAGLVDLSVVALDGTKMAADAALDQNRDAAWIRGEVAKLLAVTAAGAERPAGQLAVAGSDAAGAAEPAGSVGRLARLRAALAAIEAEEAAAAAAAAERATAARDAARQGRKLGGRKPTDPAAALARAHADHEAALTRAQAKRAARAAKVAAARAAGRALGGFAPGPDRALERAEAALAAAQEIAQQAAEGAPAAARRVNVTDPDSRIMSTQKGWVQGYNAQAVVTAHQIVLACDVSQHTGDVLLYQPMLSALTDTLVAAGISAPVGLALADAGYWSEDNATVPGPERLIATTKDHKQRRAARALGQTTGPPPEHAAPADAMEHRLRSADGAAAYAQRSHTIEPVFADRKHNRGMRAFRRRGLPAAQSEWAFMHLAGNMLKLRQHRAAAAPA